jgi:tetratricopeptide (TPR) repeat protein
LWFLIAVLLLSAGTRMLYTFQLRRTGRAALQLADRAEENGRLVDVAEWLQYYVHCFPEDGDARARYGATMAKLARSPKERSEVLSLLEDILYRDPDRQELRRECIRLLMDAGRFGAAGYHVTVLLDAAPGDTDLELLLGSCYESDKHSQKAIEVYRNGILHSPTRIELYDRLARLLQEFNRNREADEVINDLAAKNPLSARAHLTRAEYWRKTGRMEEAERDVAYARDQLGAGNDADVLWASAEIALAKGRKEDARHWFQLSLEREPKKGHLAYLRLADIDLELGKARAAEDCLRRGLKEFPDVPELRWSLAHLLIQSGNETEVNELIGELRRRSFPVPFIEYLEARMLVQKSQWAAACLKLEPLQTSAVKSRELIRLVHLQLGRCHAELGNADQQYTFYRRAWIEGDSSGEAELGIASALSAMRLFDEALAIYRLKAAQFPAARYAAVRLLIRRNKLLPPGEHRWEEIDSLLCDVAEQNEGSVDVGILRADVSAARGDYEKARTQLISLRDRRRTEPACWTALAGLADRQGKSELILPLLAEAEKHLGRRIELHIAYARYWATYGGSRAPENLDRLAQDADKFNLSDQRRLRRTLAAAYEQVGAHGRAVEAWKQAAAQQPGAFDAHLALFELAFQSGDEAGMNKERAEIERAVGPDGTPARYAHACLLLWQGRNGNKQLQEESRKLLAGVAKKRPGWSMVALRRAQLADLSERPAEAIGYFQQALELGEGNPAVAKRLVELLVASGRYIEADKVIRELPERAVRSLGLQQLAAETSVRTNDIGRAMDLAREAVAADSQDYRRHLWLGSLLWAVNRPAEAEESFRKALALGAEMPETWVALVQHLARTGRKKEAETALDEAQKKLTEDEAPLALAQCHELLGHMDRARAAYEAILSRRPNDRSAQTAAVNFYLSTNQPRSAEPLLRELVTAQAELPESGRWARGLLALLLAASGDYHRSQEACALVGIRDITSAPNAGEAESSEDLRLKAMVLAMQRGIRTTDAAIALLEASASRRPLSEADQLLLAKLYQRSGDWYKARTLLERLLAAHPGNPEYLVTAALGFTIHGEVGAAEHWLSKLETIEPQSFRTIELKARLLKARGKKAEAAAILLKRADADQADPVQIAAVMESLGLVEAEQAYRKARAAGSSEILLRLAGYLSRQGRAGEALDTLERARSAAPLDEWVTAVAATVQSSKAGPDHIRRVEKWIEEEMGKNPSNAVLLYCLAHVRIVQGRSREAELLFRRVLNLNEKNIAAMNNLAWLLALTQESNPESLLWINKAVQAAGPQPSLLDTRGLVYLSLGRTGLAVADLKEAIDVEPTAVIYFHLARAQFAAGESDAARGSLRKAQIAGLSDVLTVLEKRSYRKLLLEINSN